MIYLRWVPAGTAFSAPIASDEDIFALEITQTEDDFPSAFVDVRNPKIGLLNAGREVWAWISESDDSTDGALPLFFGRLIGIPEDMQAEVVRLAFVARPADYDDQKQTLATASKVAPYYDPIWISPDMRDDPDSILESRSELWHVDRVTHEVTLTDIISGEDGTVVFSADDHFYDDVTTTYGPTPVRKVRCEAEVFWRQRGLGSVDLTESIITAFAGAGTTVDHHITSLTGEGLMEDWPEKGDKIGGGWTVGETSIERKDGLVVEQDYVTTVLLGAQKSADFPVFTMRPHFEADYDVERRYSEKIVFELEADVQAIVTEPGDEEVIPVSLASSDIEQPVDPATTDEPDGALPIGDLRRRSYFQTDRGRESIENLLAICRAKLLARARTVEVSFATTWEAGLELSCRKNAQIFDDRLPGGNAAGKIIGYSLSMDGEGERICRVTMGCTIGQGNTVTAVTGTPVYVATGYVEEGWQQYSGAAIMPIAGEVTYTPPSDEPNDDGMDFFDLRPADVIDTLTIINGEMAQRAVLEAYLEPTFAGYPDMRAAAAAVNEVYTEIDLELVPLNTGPFETEYALTVSHLMVPRTINLEAASV